MEEMRLQLEPDKPGYLEPVDHGTTFILIIVGATGEFKDF